MRALSGLALATLLVAGCASSSEDDDGADTLASEVTATCTIAVGTAPTNIGTAGEAGEHSLILDASATSPTSWGEKDNEALILEVTRADNKRVGHVVLHQGQDRFAYGMHVGELAAGEQLSIKVSPLSSPKAAKKACVAKAELRKSTAEEVANAPILMWPVQKRFDDIPAVIGWSKARKNFHAIYTSENGGTVRICGGGARGLKSEIARWGRAHDIEGVSSYGGAQPGFSRCEGNAVPRLEGKHPIVYYGDGHNRLFESRGGYGKECGSKSDQKTDGDLRGWNVENPGNEPEKDDEFTIKFRPLAVDMDSLGYASFGGRREGLADVHAPWIYRLTEHEIRREGRIDNKDAFPMTRYMFVDIYAADVGGSGDGTCGGIPGLPDLNRVTGGFKVRAIAKNGVVSSSEQMTESYFGAKDGGEAVKRIAIRLENGVNADDIDRLQVDAYDNDGMYFIALGDAFVPVADKSNSMRLVYFNKGKRMVNVYVDDGNDGCTNGKNKRGNTEFPCVGSSFDVKKL